MPTDQAITGGVSGRSAYVACLLGLPLIAFFVSLALGRYPLSPLELVETLWASLLPGTDRSTASVVLYQVRLPRIGAAMLIGGGLAVAGAAFQGIFRNPLVSPYTLGVSSGAGFGAALGILVSGSTLTVQLMAFAFGAAAVLLCFLLARLYHSVSTLVLVLAGIIMASFFSALLSLLKYVADPYDKLPLIVYWLMGSLSTMTPAKLAAVSLPILAGLALLLAVRWRINVLTLDEDEAKSLGIAVHRWRITVILAATVITAAAVSISGIIGWVGLVVPHMARILTGPNYTRLLPACLSLGAAYLLLIDSAARCLSSAEIPLGILTALVGAPVFALLLRKGGLGWA